MYFRDFVKVCGQAVELNELLIKPDQQAYHDDIKERYFDLKSKVAQYVGGVSASYIAISFFLTFNKISWIIWCFRRNLQSFNTQSLFSNNYYFWYTLYHTLKSTILKRPNSTYYGHKLIFFTSYFRTIWMNLCCWLPLHILKLSVQLLYTIH